MKLKKKTHVVILGAGISGLTVSYFLNQHKISNTIIEKDKVAGGLLKSFKIKDFVFDNFIHISHAKNSVVKNFFKKSSSYFKLKPKPNNLYKDTWIDHSPQFHLYPLKLGEKIKIIYSFLTRKKNKGYRIKNYENWLKGAYGDYFAKNFPMKYTEKYWATKSRNLSTSWIKFRMQEISFWDLLKGSFVKIFRDTYYSSDMKYPKSGGYESFLKILKKNKNIIFNSKLNFIDHTKKKIYLGKKIIKYTNLVSTIPLPEFSNLSKEKNKKLKFHANKLRCTAGIIISIGLNVDINTRTWFYIYNKDFKASRIYAPKKLSKNNCPKGKSSLQAEIFLDNKKKVDDKYLKFVKNNTVDNLIKYKIIKKENIEFIDIKFKKYANVIFDKNYDTSRDFIINYFKKLNVDFVGRFGSWAYLWSDQCFMSGKATAQKILRENFNK